MNKEFPKIVFMGTPDFAVSSLSAIIESGYPVVGVITVPDKPAGRGKKLTESAVKQYAQANNLKILQPSNLKSPDFLQELKSLQADLQVVVAFRMLPKEVWAMPKLGTFNLHASLLPQYRGAAPINWAIINGEKETGVTTFFLNERIDEGEILFAEKTPISGTENAGELHDRLKEIGKNLVVKTIDALTMNTVTPKIQLLSPNIPLNSAPKIHKETCRINWLASGKEILNLIRGLSPYPAAYTELLDNEGQKMLLKIYKAEFELAEISSCTRKIETDNKTFLKVSVPDGYVKITELQQSGKKIMAINDFLRGCSLSKYQQAI